MESKVVSKKGKILSQVNIHGYLYVTIGNKKKAVHRLVAEAFIPNPNNLPQVNHKNGIKTDNRAENLEWCTDKENKQHAWETGLINHRSLRKITYQQAEEIRGLSGKIPQKEIAKTYGITRNAIYQIVNNKTYKHE